MSVYRPDLYLYGCVCLQAWHVFIWLCVYRPDMYLYGCAYRPDMYLYGCVFTGLTCIYMAVCLQAWHVSIWLCVYRPDMYPYGCVFTGLTCIHMAVCLQAWHVFVWLYVYRPGMYSYGCVCLPDWHVSIWLCMSTGLTCIHMAVYVYRTDMYSYGCVCLQAWHIFIWLCMSTGLTCIHMAVCLQDWHVFIWLCMSTGLTCIYMAVYVYRPDVFIWLCVYRTDIIHTAVFVQRIASCPYSCVFTSQTPRAAVEHRYNLTDSPWQQLPCVHSPCLVLLSALLLLDQTSHIKVLTYATMTNWALRVGFAYCRRFIQLQREIQNKLMKGLQASIFSKSAKSRTNCTRVKSTQAWQLAIKIIQVRKNSIKLCTNSTWKKSCVLRHTTKKHTPC